MPPSATHQCRTLPDALATVPGLNIVQTSGPGGQTVGFSAPSSPSEAPRHLLKDRNYNVR
jgi:hypothetical protein